MPRITMPRIALPRRHSLVSELTYILLKIGLAVAMLLLVRAINSPVPAAGLVLLSKWRIFAVRPRFWWPNIKSNLVDITVGLSAAFGLAQSDSLAVQVVITLGLIAWLLVIKPRSKQVYVNLQAGIAVFFGMSVLMQSSTEWPSSVVVVLAGLIGYGAARHLLTHYREKNRELLAMAWGFVMAELGWLFYHWSYAYSLPATRSLMLSQAALIALCISFIGHQAYASYHRHDGVVRVADLFMPTLFSLSVIILLLVMFNGVASGVS